MTVMCTRTKPCSQILFNATSGSSSEPRMRSSATQKSLSNNRLNAKLRRVMMHMPARICSLTHDCWASRCRLTLWYIKITTMSRLSYSCHLSSALRSSVDSSRVHHAALTTPSSRLSFDPWSNQGSALKIRK